MEVWKDIADYPGYQVSSLGKVKSLMRLTPKILKAQVGSHGYLQFNLTHRATKKIHIVTAHSIVAIAFHGARPFKHDCCHIDGNRLNNGADNLRWGTRQSNLNDQKKHGTFAWHGERKLTDSQIIEIHERLLKGGGVTSLSREFKVAHSLISGINLGIYHQDITKRTRDDANLERPRGSSVRGILNDAAVLDIDARLNAGETQLSIAKIHGVKPQTISEINLGKIWGWLTNRNYKVAA